MRTRQSPQIVQLDHPTDSPALCDCAASDRRATTEHAIIMAQSECGWRWQVIDQNGVLVARGLSADQRDALDCARATALGA